MMTSPRSATEAYARVSLETGVMAASPHQLILMLYDGALTALASARQALLKGDIPAKGKAISKAIDIVANGLKASLDKSAGGALAERLDALYEYLGNRLLYANLRNDAAALDECARLLAELKSAWQEIANDPAVVSAGRKAA